MLLHLPCLMIVEEVWTSNWKACMQARGLGNNRLANARHAHNSRNKRRALTNPPHKTKWHATKNRTTKTNSRALALALTLINLGEGGHPQ